MAVRRRRAYASSSAACSSSARRNLTGATPIGGRCPGRSIILARGAVRRKTRRSLSGDTAMRNASYQPEMTAPDYDLARLQIVTPRHYGRWLAAAAILLVLAVLVTAFADGPIAWRVVGQFFPLTAVLAGLVNTITMTVFPLAPGVFPGLVIA